MVVSSKKVTIEEIVEKATSSSSKMRKHLNYYIHSLATYQMNKHLIEYFKETNDVPVPFVLIAYTVRNEQYIPTKASIEELKKIPKSFLVQTIEPYKRLMNSMDSQKFIVHSRRLKETTKTVHDIIEEIEGDYHQYNHCSLKLEDVKVFLKGKNIVYHEIKDFILLSSIDCTLNATEEEPQYHVFIKEELEPFQKLFFALHELGHFYTRIRNNRGMKVDRKAIFERNEPIEYFVADYESLIEEYHADIIALCGILPTTEMMWMQTKNCLTEEKVYQYLLEKYQECRIDNLGKKITEAIRKNINIRIEMFRKYVDSHLKKGLETISLGYLTEDDYLFFSRRLFKDKAWVRLNKNDEIEEYSSRFRSFLKATDNRTLAGDNIFKYVHEDSLERLNQQLRERRASELPSLYSIRYSHDEVVDLVAWRTVDQKGNYAGSFAVLKPRTLKNEELGGDDMDKEPEGGKKNRLGERHCKGNYVEEYRKELNGRIEKVSLGEDQKGDEKVGKLDEIVKTTAGEMNEFVENGNRLMAYVCAHGIAKAYKDISVSMSDKRRREKEAMQGLAVFWEFNAGERYMEFVKENPEEEEYLKNIK